VDYWLQTIAFITAEGLPVSLIIQYKPM